MLALVASVLEQPWILVLGVLMFGGFQGLTQAPLDGLVSSAAGDDKQGRLAGALQSITSGIQMVGPLLAGVLYTGVAHAAPYPIGFALAIAAGVVFVRAAGARNPVPVASR